MTLWDLLGTPGEEHVEWLVVQPPHQVGQQAQRGVVGPVQVVEKEDAGGRTVEEREQDPYDLSEEATPGAGRVERRRGRRVRGEWREIRQQTGSLLQRAGRQALKAAGVFAAERG